MILIECKLICRDKARLVSIYLIIIIDYLMDSK